MSESHTPESTWEDPRITAYVLGELPEADRAAFESEMESDSDLAAAVEEARSVTGQLESLYAAEPTAGLDDERRESIVAGESATLVSTDGRSWKIPALVLATAAALLLLVGVAPWLKQERELSVTQVETRSSEQPAPMQVSGTEESFDDLDLAGELHELAVDMPSAGSADKRASVKYAVDSSRELGAGGGKEQMDRGESRASAVSDQYAATDPALAAQPSNPAPRPSSLANGPASQAKSRRGGESGQANSEAFMRKSDFDAEGDSGVIGETQIQMVPELGTIVVRGSRRDVERVKDVVEKLESESVRAESLAKGAQPRSTSAPSPVQLQAGRQKITASAAQAPVSSRMTRARSVNEAVTGEAKKKLSQLAISGQAPIGGGGFGGADYGLAIDEGRGAGIAGDRFEPITDNPFKRVSEHPLSTFSVDVDTASYSKVRDFLVRANQLPRPDAVRIEELLNYFDYDYEPPSAEDKHPFAARAVVTSCPWNDNHRLARIALKGKTMDKAQRPPCNLVFLLDTSGSMNAPNKLPLVIEGMQMLVEQLNEQDKVAITVYAGSAGLVLDSTSAKKSKKIRKALTQLSAGGSTNGGAGIALAYQTARDNFISEGVNRVILCTDGDFNVGTTGTDELVRMVENEAKGGVFLSVLGFGMGNHNDAMLEKVSGRGNGNYAFIDTQQEARKVLVDQTSGTLVTIAKDVKLQIEFNPNQVSAYRLIGYENRILAKEDFNDDKKDAGEIGAGHAVTALYEIVAAGMEPDAGRPEVDDLKYQAKPETTAAAQTGEMMTLKLRYKQPDGDTSTLVEFPVADEDGKFEDADDDVRFAAAVASFGMQIRRSEYAGNWTMSDAMNVANRAKGEDRYGLRAEFVELVQKASLLMGEE